MQVLEILSITIIFVLLKPHILGLGLHVPMLFLVLLAVRLHVGEVLFPLILKSVVDLS